MASVDLRTRRADDVTAVDPGQLFDHELPAAFAADGPAFATAGALELRPRTLAIEVDGAVWTLAADPATGAVTVKPGESAAADAPARLRLSAEHVTDLVHDLTTPMGWFTGGELHLERGRLDDALDWWVLVRSVLDGIPAHTAGAVTFRDLAGAPLDLTRSFSLDDDLAERQHFLAEAGFLHLRDVYDPAEMAAVSREMDEAAPGYREGDGRSWWARTAEGARVVRMQHFDQVSPSTDQLLDDERLLGLADLTHDGHVHGKPGGNTNVVEALVKPIGVVEGISDLPWHKDCSLGSHSYRCCSLTVGISVTGADAGSGQLGVVAGSHRALVQPAFVRRGLDLPIVPLPTGTGDITVHLSCTLHMSHAPVSRERRVLYTDFRLPTRPGDRDPSEGRIAKIREGAPTTVSQPRAATTH